MCFWDICIKESHPYPHTHTHTQCRILTYTLETRNSDKRMVSFCYSMLGNDYIFLLYRNIYTAALNDVFPFRRSSSTANILSTLYYSLQHPCILQFIKKYIYDISLGLFLKGYPEFFYYNRQTITTSVNNFTTLPRHLK